MSRARPRSIPGLPDEVVRRGDYLTRDQALEVLGIKPQTLYCYVSRGYIRSVPQPDGRSSYYRREDVERVRTRSVARSGHGPAAAAAMRWGEPVVGTSITEITPEGPRYRHRGVVELAQSRHGFETVAEFLWGGVLAEDPVEWRRSVPPAALARTLNASLALHPKPHLLQLLTLATTSLGVAEGSRRERIQSGATPVMAARRLIRTLAGTFGFLGPERAFVDLRDREPVARGLLRALGLPAGRDQVALLDAALVMVADHELNPATFSARIAASGSADLHCCIGAALNTHQGTLIGRACDRLEQVFALPSRPSDMVQRAREALDTARSVPGFNHHLYPQGDPRARALIELARREGGANIGVRHMLEALELIEQELGLHPSVECSLVFVSRALGMPDQCAGGLFALGRSAGWVAHVMEQRLAGFMIRPRARFTGAAAGMGPGSALAAARVD
jgi:citrate synthase